jgi:hypothetical protein
MTIRFLCPHGHKLAVPDNLAGKKGRCPVCQQRVYIPVLQAGDVASEGPHDGPPLAGLGVGSSVVSPVAGPPLAGSVYAPIPDWWTS